MRSRLSLTVQIAVGSGFMRSYLSGERPESCSDWIHSTKDMTDPKPASRYRFGVFEADATTGELRKKGVRIKLNSQPLQVLFMLLERPGELLTREEISRELWPDGTFVDYEHGVNSAVNRIREALGDRAASPRFVETLARRGYRFVVPVERIALQEDGSTIGRMAEVSEEPAAPRAESGAGLFGRVLATQEDLP